MLKKILIIVSGIVLVILGFIAIYVYVMGGLAAAHGSTSWEIFRSTLVVMFPILIISGITLFSFKEWARKFAVFSYITVLSYILVFIISGLLSSKSINVATFIDFIIWLTPIAISIVIPVFFIVVLTTYNKRALILLAISILALSIIFYSSIPYKAKQYKIEKGKVEQLIVNVQPQIQNDRRFKKIIFYVDEYAVLHIIGTVENQRDYDALKETVLSIVLSYKLPKYVEFYEVTCELGPLKDTVDGKFWRRK